MTIVTSAAVALREIRTGNANNTLETSTIDRSAWPLGKESMPGVETGVGSQNNAVANNAAPMTAPHRQRVRQNTITRRIARPIHNRSSVSDIFSGIWKLTDGRASG